MSRNEVARVIDEAKRLGFTIDRAKSGHLKFIKEGIPAVFFSSTPSDPRAWKNGISKLRRAAGAGACV